MSACPLQAQRIFNSSVAYFPLSLLTFKQTEMAKRLDDLGKGDFENVS